MRASVQYNDFVGSAAADIADAFVNSMDEYLSVKSKKYDKTKYHCIGCELRPYGIDKLDVEFYCRDMQTRQIVTMRFNSEFKLSDILVMFKRFAVVMGENIEDVDTPQSETIYLE